MATLIPRLPVTVGSLLLIRTKAQIQAENDERANRARETAHVVTPVEQVEREKRARSKGAPKAVATAAPKGPQAPTLVATLVTLTGDTRSVFEDGSVLPQVVSALRADSTLRAAKLATGVCLSLWSGDVCIRRAFYVNAASAYAAGEADDTATRFTVSAELTRGEVLAGDRPLARDTLTASREYQACKRTGSVYGGNHQWNMSAHQTRAIFSHG